MNTIVSNYRGSYINSNSREGRRNSCIQPTTNPRISMIGNPGNSRIENPGNCETRRMSSMYNDIQPTAGLMNHKKSFFVLLFPLALLLLGWKDKKDYIQYFLSNLKIVKGVTKGAKVLFKQDNVVLGWGATLSCSKLDFNVITLFLSLFESLH